MISRVRIVNRISRLNKRGMQWNLSIADMLYSGHLFTADTFSRDQLSQATVKFLYFEPLYSGHLSIADMFSENQWYPLLRGFTVRERSHIMSAVEGGGGPKI